MYNTKLTNTFSGIVFATSLLLSSSSFAAEQGGKERRAPPTEAIESCAGLEAGAQCSFEGRRGNVTGTCFTPSEDKPLACKPNRGRKGNSDERNPESE